MVIHISNHRRVDVQTKLEIAESYIQMLSHTSANRKAIPSSGSVIVSGAHDYIMSCKHKQTFDELVVGATGTKKNFISECVGIKQGKRDPVSGVKLTKGTTNNRNTKHNHRLILTNDEESALRDAFQDPSKMSVEWQNGNCIPIPCLRTLICTHILGVERYKALVELRVGGKKKRILSDRYLRQLRSNIVVQNNNSRRHQQQQLPIGKVEGLVD